MRIGLTAKFAIISGIVLMFTMAVFTLFNIASLRRAFLQVYINDADNLSETIIRTTYHAMLDGDLTEAFKVMEHAGRQENIQNIRLVDKNGVVRYSLNQAEVASRIDKFADPGCQMCHTGKTTRTDASTMDRSAILRDREGRQVLRLTRALYNQDACYQAPCHYHPADARLLGVLEVVMSMQGLLTQVERYRDNVVVEILFLVLALTLCLYLMISRLITAPVRTLLDHTRFLSKGEWKVIEDPPADELGDLAEAFNEMTASLRKAREERDTWAATLESRVDERTRQIKEIQTVLVRSEKLASLGELAAGIAHELNNPLTGIVLHASFISQQAILPPELAEDLGTITSEADRCAQIVRNLLDFARNTEPSMAVNYINETLDRALHLVEHLASFQNIVIVKEYAENLPPVLMDAGQMEQVFINMFVNASQAMDNGGKLTLWTGLDLDGESVVVGVQDTGRGIPEQHLGRIFDPFFSTKGAKGTGLGLSVSYGIIERHGGTIHVDSTVGKGTTFTVTLPA